MLTTSAQGRALLEGFEGRRLDAYQDDKGNWTIGVGHLLTPTELTLGVLVTGAAWREGITAEQCDTLLEHDLIDTETPVNKLVTAPLQQNQFDALVCLVFNIGPGNFGRSSVLHCINIGDTATNIAAHWELWNESGQPPTVDPLLVKRRAAEVQCYETPYVT